MKFAEGQDFYEYSLFDGSVYIKDTSIIIYKGSTNELTFLDPSTGAKTLRELAETGGGSGSLDSSIDYGTYDPRESSIAFTYDPSGNVTNVTTINDIGTKEVDFTYDASGDVTQIDISTYGINNRKVTFVKDINGNVTEINIVNI